MKIEPIAIAVYVFFIFITLVIFGFPIIAIQSTFEVYNAANNYKKPEEINISKLSKGDTFWAQMEISDDNEDTLGLVAYTSYYWHKTTHLWSRTNIKTYVPERIFVNAGENKNISLLLNTNIIDFVYLHTYDSPFIGFFSITKNWLPTVTLSIEKKPDGSCDKATGLKEGGLMLAKYKVESVNPLVLSTNNPCCFTDPKRLWEEFTSGFFWPFAHILAGIFLIIGVFILISKLKYIQKKKLKSFH